MTTKTKLLAAAAAVLLLAGGALVLSPSSLPTTSPPPAAPEVASRTAVTPEAPDVTPPLPAPSPVDRARALPEAAGASTGALHGTIRYDGGVPVADAPVLLWGPGHLVAARTDSRGAYRFERVPFRGLGAGWTLRLGSKAATRMLGPVVVREGEDTEADFEISRVASLLISVRTPDGGPAGGVPVRLAPESGRTDTSAYGTTAPTGDLRFEWLAPRPYRVFVAASERWSAWSGRVDPEAWPENAPFLIELAASRALVVRVKNWPEGAEGPIQVSLTRLDGVGVPSWSTGKLDDRGMFTGTAPMPGEYRAFIRVAGQTCSLPRVVVPDHGPTEIDIDAPEGAVVEGRLLTAEGKPVPEATLWLRPATGGSGSPCGPTSEDGRFRILFVPTGDCILSARVGKLTYYALDPRTIEVGPAGVTGLDVRLPDRGTGSIAGRLVGFRSDGAAGRLRSLEVEREGPSGWRLYAMAGADGAEFRIDGLPAGRFRLEVPSMPIADLEESGATTVSLGEGEQKGGVEIHAETASQVVLALRRSDGRPFVEAVTPIATREGNHGRRMLILRPNAEGLCRVRLAPGTWRLACPGGPARMTVREIVVPERPGGPIEVVLW